MTTTENNKTIPIVIVGVGVIAIVAVLFLAPKSGTTDSTGGTSGAIDPSKITTDALNQMAGNDIAVDNNYAQIEATKTAYEKCKKACGANIANWFDTPQKREQCRTQCYNKYYPKTANIPVKATR